MHAGRFIFSQLMDFLRKYEYDKCVRRYRGNHRVRTFSCYDQFLCMAFAQLTYRESLRDVVTCLDVLKSKLFHVGIRGKVSRSTLADANENRDWRIYADFAQVLIAEARGLYANEDFGVELDNTVYALDASTIDLCLSLFPWARFRKTKGAVKLHTLLNLRGNIPEFIHISDGKLHDVNVLDIMIPEAGSVYVMDRGYVDFKRLYALHQATAFFCHAGQEQFSVQETLLSPRRQNNRAAMRSNYRADGCPFQKRLPRNNAPGRLPRWRNGQALRLPNKQFRAAAAYHRAVVQSSLASRVVLQVDQTTPAHQVVLRNVGERRQDPNLDSRLRLRARGHRQEAAWSRPQPLHNPTDSERRPIRDDAHFTGIFRG